MANEIIKPHKFEEAKNKIHDLALKIPSNVNFTPFPTEGTIFSWNDHNITGKEVNKNLVTPLQGTIIDLYSNIRSLYNIPNEIYKALDSLDKEYIEAIKGSIKAAKIASDQALKASAKAKKASSEALKASKEAREASKGVETAQTDIRKTIDALQATVKKLKEFKESVNNVLSSFSLQKFADDINALQEYRKMLESYAHLGNIDTMWNDVEGHKKNLSELHQKVDGFIKEVNQATGRISEDISALRQYRTTLESYSHLGDIDAMWNDVEGHKKNLIRLIQQQEDARTAIEDIGERISVSDQTNKERNISVNKKIKIAYGIAGGSMALTIILLVLQLLGIL